MKLLRALMGCAVVGGAFLAGMPVASPQAPGVLGVSQRGVGAHARSRVLRGLEAGAPAELANPLLAELRVRRDAAGETLSTETIDGLARDVLSVRNANALAALRLRATQKSFLGGIVNAASWADWERGIPASVTLAQAILESGWGRSAPGYNYFGIKGIGPAGSTLGWGVDWSWGRRRVLSQALRAYESPEQAMADHADLLGGSRHYAPARRVAAEPRAFARRLQGVYASDPRYAARLDGVIEAHGLDRFDVDLPAPYDPTAH